MPEGRMGRMGDFLPGNMVRPNIGGAGALLYGTTRATDRHSAVVPAGEVAMVVALGTSVTFEERLLLLVSPAGIGWSFASWFALAEDDP